METKNEVKKSLYTSLKELGLTEQEADFYILSLRLGPSNITKLAENLKISRPNVYKLIKGLEKHNLAKFSQETKYTRKFVVEAPTNVLELLRKKRENIANLDHNLASNIPDLLALYHQGAGATKIKVMQGKDQWLKVFWQILDEAKEKIEFFGSADAFIELVGWEEERKWIKKRVKKEIHMNVLLTLGKDAGTLQENDPKEMRTTHLFKGEIPFVTGFMLYANKVIFWQPKAPLLILIEDEYIVEMFRSIFNVMWEKNRDVV